MKELKTKRLETVELSIKPTKITKNIKKVKEKLTIIISRQKVMVVDRFGSNGTISTTFAHL